MADSRLLTEEIGQALDDRDIDWGVTKASTLLTGDRRMEASSYLSDGYGRRIAIESRPTGWLPIGDISRVWQPSRLKGIVVSPEHGTPFLAAGQVFEAQPSARKFLALDRTPDAENRFVRHGTILLSCSGTVGRATVAHHPHDHHIVTHDLLRIDPTDARLRGWIYAYMRTPAFRSMATSSHYGHVIKHLEPEHVDALPILSIEDRLVDEFATGFNEVLASRDEAGRLVDEAFALYERALGPTLPPTVNPCTFTLPAHELLRSNRHRLDASHYTPTIRCIFSAMHASAMSVDRLPDVTERVWWPSRFKRTFGPNGTPYVSADELFDLNPPITKRIYAGLVHDAEDYCVEPGWLLMARSGQIYGLNGRVLMTSERHREFFVSEDIIRIIPDLTRIAAGYLQAVLGHPTLGRPLVLSHAYGTSIPHLEPADLAMLPVPRFEKATESAISERMETAASLRSRADQTEDTMTQRATKLVEAFVRVEL